MTIIEERRMCRFGIADWSFCPEGPVALGRSGQGCVPNSRAVGKEVTQLLRFEDDKRNSRRKIMRCDSHVGNFQGRTWAVICATTRNHDETRSAECRWVKWVSEDGPGCGETRRESRNSRTAWHEVESGRVTVQRLDGDPTGIRSQ